MSTHTPWDEQRAEIMRLRTALRSYERDPLIAAAPDLLAALKMADTILDGFPLYATGHGGKTIRAAIAKAEGTQ